VLRRHARAGNHNLVDVAGDVVSGRLTVSGPEGPKGLLRRPSGR
jgi:hypothetical protein